MRNLFLASLALVAALTTQSADARNPFKDVIAQQHHSGDGSSLQLGSYLPLCLSGTEFIGGAAAADARTVNVNGHNRLVVHLKGQGSANAIAFVNNLDTVSVAVNAPIQFTLEKGNGRFLLVNVGYIPRGGSSSDEVILNFVTPDTKLGSILTTETLLPMHTNGSGKYIIPLGSGGIPQGATLTNMSFGQLANPQNCTNHASNFDELMINKQFVGIATDGGSSCGNPCGGEGGGGAEE